MTKFEKIAVASSLLIAITGLIFGYMIDGIYFSRSGSLIVVVGIIYGLLDLPSRLANIDSWVENEAKKNKDKILEANKTEGISAAKSEQVFEEVVKDMTDEIKNRAKKARQRLVFIEGSILVIGTLIWGFGDIVNSVPCYTS